MNTNKKRILSLVLSVVLVLSAGFSLISASAKTSSITVAKAKSIALKHAGLKAEDVIFTKAKSDHDDGVKVYDIEFYSSTAEHEYEISASSGKILSYDKENFKVPKIIKKSTSTKTTDITLAKAKSIALKDAGLKESEVKFTKEKVDFDNGAKHYEIEFRADGIEYDYEINAKTGKITAFEKDKESSIWN